MLVRYQGVIFRSSLLLSFLALAARPSGGQSTIFRSVFSVHPSFWNSACDEERLVSSREPCPPSVPNAIENLVKKEENVGGSPSEDADNESSSRDGAPTIAVISPAEVEIPQPHVQWKSLLRQSGFYLGIMHGYRIATEAGTRDGLHNSVVGGYFKALGAMHGWSDGDGYYENYLGHPIQGAVSGYVWLHNDPRYRVTEFGWTRDYWMGRLRAMAFIWAFSAQFEVGPISEASIGQIQRYCCEYGFVDHVITPAAGTGWLIGEDILDKYVVRKIEDHTHNEALRILARIALNPPQSFANVIGFQAPSHRENRVGAGIYQGELLRVPEQPLKIEVSKVPRFELTAELPTYLRFGNHACVGGGAIGGMRVKNSWQWTVEVGGCSLRNLPQNWSGDSLTFTTGPNWIHTHGRWSLHLRSGVGVQKVTQEYINPQDLQTALSNLQPGQGPRTVHNKYAKDYETTGFSLSFGGGLDVTLNRAFALRLGNLEYAPSWLGQLNGVELDQGFRFSSGIVLRIGTW